MNTSMYLLLVNIFIRDTENYDTVLLGMSENLYRVTYLKEDYIIAVSTGYNETIKFFKDNNAIYLNSRVEFNPDKYTEKELRCTSQSVFIKEAMILETKLLTK